MATVKMKHSETGKTADVHKDEVDNYIAGGYVLVRKAQPKKAVKAAK